MTAELTTHKSRGTGPHYVVVSQALAMQSSRPTRLSQLLRMPMDHALIDGLLEFPEKPAGVMVFAHGSGLAGCRRQA
ncbi:MAG: hypothetical protein PHT57_09795 [Rhodoferax sp.]|nr:hypothetical protein [Rhodoferax sp.]